MHRKQTKWIAEHKPNKMCTVQDAVQETECGGEGISLREVSKKYNIPATTLHNYLHGKV